MEPNETRMTCQICGRKIKANTGVIAHHGYQRPGGGWQTSSCQGARYLPYEQSCTRIPEVIQQVKGYIAGRTMYLETIKVTAPEKLVYEKYRGAWRSPAWIDVPRPDDFDLKNARDNGISSSYEHLYASLIRRLESDIKMSKLSLEALEKRLADWKATEPSPVPSAAE